MNLFGFFVIFSLALAIPVIHEVSPSIGLQALGGNTYQLGPTKPTEKYQDKILRPGVAYNAAGHALPLGSGHKGQAIGINKEYTKQGGTRNAAEDVGVFPMPTDGCKVESSPVSVTVNIESMTGAISASGAASSTVQIFTFTLVEGGGTSPAVTGAAPAAIATNMKDATVLLNSVVIDPEVPQNYETSLDKNIKDRAFTDTDAQSCCNGIPTDADRLKSPTGKLVNSHMVNDATGKTLYTGIPIVVTNGHVREIEQAKDTRPLAEGYLPARRNAPVEIGNVPETGVPVALLDGQVIELEETKDASSGANNALVGRDDNESNVYPYTGIPIVFVDGRVLEMDVPRGDTDVFVSPCARATNPDIGFVGVSCAGNEA